MSSSWRRNERIQRLCRKIARRLTDSGPRADLAVLAYHRAGRRDATRYDPWVFTADADQLEQHIRYIKQRFVILNLEQALAVAAGRERTDGAGVLFTFDDGYLDNYEVAFPVLRAHGVPAVFFLVSSFAAGGVIPWWDEIAWLIQSTAQSRVSVRGTGRDFVSFDLKRDRRRDAVMRVLDFYKSTYQGSSNTFIEALANECKLSRPVADGRLFLSWNEARELIGAGMTIGGHTHTHPILGRLSQEEQTQELARSRGILERELGATVDLLAYPVGGKGDFTSATEQALQDCGYRAAFSCYGGWNIAGHTHRFDIKRIPVYWGAQPADLLEEVYS